jgi:hypothetical protein
MEPFKEFKESEASLNCTCEQCGEPFVVTGAVLEYFKTFRYCTSKCADIAYEIANPKPKTETTLKNYPPIYWDTDVKRLPEKLAASAVNWYPKVGKGHLLIHGSSRAGKTRTAWEVCKRLHREGFAVEGYTVRQLEEKLYEGMGRNNHHAMFRHLAQVQVLFIDDLGKEHMSKAGRLAPDLFALIDERTSWKKHTIITTNHMGDGLRERFGDAEMGTAFVARLREFFDITCP